MKQVLLLAFCLSTVLTVELQAQTYSNAGEFYWNNNAAWAGIYPTESPNVRDLVISTGSTIQSNNPITLSFTDLTVQSDGILFMDANLRLSNLSTLTIQNGGTAIFRSNLIQDPFNPIDVNGGGTLVVLGTFENNSPQLTNFDGTQYIGNTEITNFLTYIYGPSRDAHDDIVANDIAPLSSIPPGSLLDNLLNMPNGPLPVILREFYTEQAMQGAAVNWVTESEINFSHYELYHSTDGENFGLIKTIQGVGTEAGATAYQYMHGRPQEGWNYYRLVAVDIDGSTEEHGVRSLYFDGKGMRRVVQNPVANQKLILSPVGLTEEAQLIVFSMEGNQVYQSPVGDGIHQLNAKPGLYVLKIVDEGGSEQHRIIIQ